MVAKLFRSGNLELFERGEKNKEKNLKCIGRYVENLFAQFDKAVVKKNKFQ